MLTNIEVDRIYPHPNNPRKDLGDLTELAESIKARGVLQNLTVVPMADVDPDAATKLGPDTYTVIIGHRRLAAAKLAGLAELPCVISSMDEKTQIATMLLENIQRNDLTVYEEAQGFQMMLDLGITVGDISKQTGFSDSTVRRRVKLLELDRNKFAQSIERGATLADYDALNKIKDIKVRNKVLEKIGTENFAWELKTAIGDQTKAENKIIVLAELEKFAVKIKDSEASEYQCVRYISLASPEFDVPEDAGNAKYFYTDGNSMYLYKERAAQAKPRKTPEEIEREKREKELKALFSQAYELRLAFAKGFRGTGKTVDAVDKKAVEVLFASSSSINEDVFRGIFGIEEKFRDSWELKEKGETYEEAFSRIMSDNAKTLNTTLLFWGVYCQLEDPKATCLRWGDPFFSADEELVSLYGFLTELGYAMSDEEKALMDGSHELFYKEDADGR